MKRVITRAVVGIIAFMVVGQIVGYALRRFLGHDADPYEDEFDIVNVMGGSELVSRAGALRAGTARTYCGGTEIDLRRAELAPGGAYLEITTACGGTEILVPPGWRVDVQGVPTAGGHEIEVPDPDDLPFDAPHLVIDAKTFCGGLEVTSQALAESVPAAPSNLEAAPSSNGAREPAVSQAD
jgi:hypothetical protein